MSTGLNTRASAATTAASTTVGGGGGLASATVSTPAIVQPQTVNVGVSFHQYHLTDITPQTLKLLQTNLEQAANQGITVDRHKLIDDSCKDIITLQFTILDICAMEGTWELYDNKTFFQHMAKAFGDLSGQNNLTPFDHMRQFITKQKFNFDAKTFTSCVPYIKEFKEMLEKSGAKGTLTQSEHTALFKLCMEKLQHSNPNDTYAPCVSAIKDALKM